MVELEGRTVDRNTKNGNWQHLPSRSAFLKEEDRIQPLEARLRESSQVYKCSFWKLLNK